MPLPSQQPAGSQKSFPPPLLSVTFPAVNNVHTPFCSAPVSADGSPTDLILPLARVRKTIRLDPTVGNITKEGLQLVAKATEVFMEVMADRAWRVGRQVRNTVVCA